LILYRQAPGRKPRPSGRSDRAGRVLRPTRGMSEGTGLTYWGIGTARTIRPIWILEELGLDYAHHAIQPRSGQLDEPEMQRINPRHKVPMLRDGDLVLHESAAIVTHLGERYGSKRGLVPPAGSDDRARYDDWAFTIMTELDAILYVIRRHRDLADVYGASPEAVKGAGEYFTRMVAETERELSDGRTFLLGDVFTGVDVLLATTLQWAVIYGIGISDALETYRARVCDRESFLRAFQINFPPEILKALLQGGSRSPIRES
jgi:glutathione S-transferase